MPLVTRRATLLLSALATIAVGCASVPPPSAPPEEPLRTRRFVGPPVAFEFPAGWGVFAGNGEDTSGTQSSGDEATGTPSEQPANPSPGTPSEQPANPAPGPSSRVLVGFDVFNRVVVTGFRGDIVVTPENFQQVRGVVEADVEGGLELTGRKVTSNPEVVTIGGHPALQWVTTSQTHVGYVVTTTVYVTFRGSREYRVECSHIPPRAREIDLGCSTILETAEFTYQAPLAPVPASAPSGGAVPVQPQREF